LPIDILRELEESLILCDSGCDHNSGEIHQDQYLQMQQKKVQNKIQSNVNLAYTMRNQLLRGQLLEFGKSLNEAWQLKRQFSDKISNSYLDQIYQASLENGAIGGKLLGAGGGGFFLFFAPPFNKHKLISWLNSQHLKVYPFRFDLEGLNAWSSRDVSEQK
jgi:D-glycero-alpha-D-manno-heptose-7-phosphate kinase